MISHGNYYACTTIIYIFNAREDLSKLSYTTMCIKESLRLYPPVPYIAKELSEDFFVEGNRIPKGLVISRVYQREYPMIIYTGSV